MASEETPLLRDPEETDGPVSTYDATANSEDGVTEGRPQDSEAQAEEVLKPEASIIAVMIPMFIGIFLVAMDQTIVASTYASIGSQFESLQSTSWIATGYMLTLTSFQPLYGKLSDIFGRKACLIFAYVVFAFGCLFCGLAANMTSLIAARALAGIGGGGMGTVASIIMSDVVPLRKRGTWQGVGNLVYAAGSSIGAPLGGLLADSIGWRWAFLIQVPMTVLAILSVSVYLKLPKHDNSDFTGKLKRVDFAGAATLVTAVFALLLALDQGGNVSWRDHITLASLAVSAAMALAFVVVELRIAKEPFAPKHIVANPSLIASYLCNFFANAVVLLVMFQVPLYLQAVRGLSASRVGLALLPSVVGGVTGSLLGGLIMQSTGKYYWLSIGGFALMLFGVVLVTCITGIFAFSFAALAVGLAATNMGGGAGITTTLIALIANAGPENQAVATAVSYLFRSLGSVLGLSIGTTLSQGTIRRRLHERLSGEDVEKIITRVRESLSYLDRLEPTVRKTVVQSYEDGIQVTMWFAVALAVTAVICSFFIKEKSLGR
ncbi:MFS general substrate transporter [Amylocystis lapponica]|nr:MFS general substrate transporter [Amylocystis lapponica]